MSIRTEKVAEEIKHQISAVLSKDLSELSSVLGLVTVTRVKISKDLKNARIYVSFLANKEPADVCLEKIKSRAKQIRMHLGSKIHLRVVPELDFYFDDTIEYASRIDELIKEIHKDENKSGDSTSDQ